LTMMISILSSHLLLCLPCDLIPWGFLTRIFYRCHFPSECYVILFHWNTLKVYEEQRLWSSFLCNFFHAPVACTSLHPVILRDNLFSNTVNLCSYFGDRNLLSTCSSEYTTATQEWYLYYCYLVPDKVGWWGHMYPRKVLALFPFRCLCLRYVVRLKLHCLGLWNIWRT
jgi:hypothetical protein